MSITFSLSDDQINRVVVDSLIDCRERFQGDLSDIRQGVSRGIFTWDDDAEDEQIIRKHIAAIETVLSWYAEEGDLPDDIVLNEEQTSPDEYNPARLSDEPILRFFLFSHLPDPLKAISKPFCELAYSIIEKVPPSEERTVSLRKLLEAKDAAVRAAI